MNVFRIPDIKCSVVIHSHHLWKLIQNTRSQVCSGRVIVIHTRDVRMNRQGLAIVVDIAVCSVENYGHLGHKDKLKSIVLRALWAG